LFEKLNDVNSVSTLQGNIGETYRKMRNYNKAIECFNSSLNLGMQINDSLRIENAIASLGAVYYDINDLEKSLYYFKSGLAYYKSVEDFNKVALSQNNIGSIYNELEKYPEAIANYKEAMDIFLNLKDSTSYAMCLANIGNVYNNMKDYKQGIDYALRGLDISFRLNDRNTIAACYVFLAEGYQFSGDYQHAFKYQTKLLNLKDTIYDLKTNQNIAEMQTRYDTEKKEKQNQILKQENDLQNLSINRQKIINYSITLGLVLVIGLAFFIFKGYKQKQKANLQLEEKNILIGQKNKIVEEKNKDITDSIRYAKRLQTAILKPENTLANYFDDGFILFIPKDIVSGDFYWFEKFGNLSLIAAADCTGHGVPGAFMSIIGCNLLSQAVNEYAITYPAAILNSINKGLTKVLQQKGEAGSIVKDGMDIALCSFDPEKIPVGAFIDSEIRTFKCHEIPVLKGDMLYMFSDGYADQFGGTAGKKFKYKPFQKLLMDIYKKPCAEQRAILSDSFDSWKGSLEQIDDVLVIGIRI
ncbi:MAG: tetratricopeptide repeat protein, partial [Bacteroidetes bacterium]|nr:tetratricopeptide repeat protein [Bacteroidota bacterium]